MRDTLTIIVGFTVAGVLAQWPSGVAMMEPIVMPMPVDAGDFEMPAEMFDDQKVTADNVTLSGTFKGVKEGDVEIHVSGAELQVNIKAHSGQGGEGETMRAPREIVPDKVVLKVIDDKVTIVAPLADPAPGEDTKDEQMVTEEMMQEQPAEQEFANAENGLFQQLSSAEQEMQSGLGGFLNSLTEQSQGLPQSPDTTRAMAPPEDESVKVKAMKDQLEKQASQIEALKQSQEKAMAAFQKEEGTMHAQLAAQKDALSKATTGSTLKAALPTGEEQAKQATSTVHVTQAAPGAPAAAVIRNPFNTA